MLEELRQIKEEQARQGEEQRKQTEMLVVVMELSIEAVLSLVAQMVKSRFCSASCATVKWHYLLYRSLC